MVTFYCDYARFMVIIRSIDIPNPTSSRSAQRETLSLMQSDFRVHIRVLTIDEVSVMNIRLETRLGSKLVKVKNHSGKIKI